jgi:hypothetical protein
MIHGQLTRLTQIAEKARDAYPNVEWFNVVQLQDTKIAFSVVCSEHIAAFDPTTCLELLEEVERLRDQWNTRFNTLCGNCGKRYLGPRDGEQHGLGICGGAK